MCAPMYPISLSTPVVTPPNGGYHTHAHTHTHVCKLGVAMSQNHTPRSYTRTHMNAHAHICTVVHTRTHTRTLAHTRIYTHFYTMLACCALLYTYIHVISKCVWGVWG